ncbi:MFS transporter [Gallaecimonas mangrovi]|uniref:MFS transporter n=1 Tax=Gallaecimonas mangrovi TaxID=2291597 RepID=UPI001D0056B9|nr:MFS transporter [Gallaecimonas mangrovi]
MRLSFKSALIVLTLIAVVGDAMLVPFYPRFFAEAFARHNAHWVGLYLAAICAVVMLAFPVWARLARGRSLLNILIATQLVAAALSLSCYWVTSFGLFWLASLLMLAFKASYLLIYPQIMALEQQQHHGRTIGLLSVTVHFGAIAGALLGGGMLQWLNARDIFVLMALGDVLQTALCLWLKRRQPPLQAAPSPAKGQGSSWRLLVRLCSVMVLFYFSIYLIRPFFTRYWEGRSGIDDTLVSGLVFALPAGVALLALWRSYRHKTASDPWQLLGPLSFLVIGVLLQSALSPLWVLIGRLLFGWGLYHATVRLDQLLFRLSTPAHYATDFAKVSFSQNLGVLMASWLAGYLNSAFVPECPFFVATVSLLACALVFTLFLKPATSAGNKPTLSRSDA